MEVVVKPKPSNSDTGNRGTKSMFKKHKKTKKLSFTPTQASETSQKYYELDEKSIISFDNVVKQNENKSIDFKSLVRHSSPVKTNLALDLYQEYNDIVKSIKSHKRKNSCFSSFQTKKKYKK